MRRLGSILPAALIALGVARLAAAASYNVSFTGIVTEFATNGFCGTSDFNSQCPSGLCDCLELTGRAAGSLIGRTAADGAEIDITFDLGGPAVGWGSNAQCGQIYGSAFLTGTRDSERLDFLGSLCLLDSDFTPHRAPLAGTFGLADLDGTHEGFGSVRGTVNLFDFSRPQKLTFSGIAH
jgi:hypothetical protein